MIQNCSFAAHLSLSSALPRPLGLLDVEHHAPRPLPGPAACAGLRAFSRLLSLSSVLLGLRPCVCAVLFLSSVCVSWLLMAALDDDDAPLLTSLFGAEPAAADVLHYGPLRLRVIAKEGALTARLRAELAGRANSLLADAIFSAAFALAEYIEAGHTSGFTSVLELGAASGLPSLLLASRADGPSLAVLTDYPAEEIVGVTRANALSNASAVREGCRIEVRGHRWGDDVSQLLCVSVPCRALMWQSSVQRGVRVRHPVRSRLLRDQRRSQY